MYVAICTAACPFVCITSFVIYELCIKYWNSPMRYEPIPAVEPLLKTYSYERLCPSCSP